MQKEEFLKKLQVELTISKNSEYTIRNYTKANEVFLDFTKKTPDKIDEDDVKLYIAQNIADNSASSIIVFLSAIKYAYSNILKNDPTVAIKRPKKEKKLPTVLSKEEIKRLLKSLDTKKSQLMVSLMYACGMRVSELVNLEITNLDFEEKIGHIRQAKGRKDRIFNIPEFLTTRLKKQIHKSVDDMLKITTEFD